MSSILSDSKLTHVPTIKLKRSDSSRSSRSSRSSSSSKRSRHEVDSGDHSFSDDVDEDLFRRKKMREKLREEEEEARLSMLRIPKDRTEDILRATMEYTSSNPSSSSSSSSSGLGQNSQNSGDSQQFTDYRSLRSDQYRIKNQVMRK